jgi:hypothetical protein
LSNILVDDVYKADISACTDDGGYVLSIETNIKVDMMYEIHVNESNYVYHESNTLCTECTKSEIFICCYPIFHSTISVIITNDNDMFTDLLSITTYHKNTVLYYTIVFSFAFGIPLALILALCTILFCVCIGYCYFKKKKKNDYWNINISY